MDLASKPVVRCSFVWRLVGLSPRWPERVDWIYFLRARIEDPSKTHQQPDVWSGTCAVGPKSKCRTPFVQLIIAEPDVCPRSVNIEIWGQGAVKKPPASLTDVQGEAAELYGVCACVRKHSSFVFSIRHSYFPYINPIVIPIVIPKSRGSASIPIS